MPVPVAQAVLKSAATVNADGSLGDLLGPIQLGVTGVGNPVDTTAVVSFSGVTTAAGASIIIEGVPIGQPLTQPTPGTTTLPTPNSVNEWVACLDVSLLNGAAQANPITFTSAGGAGSGLAVAVGSGMYQQIRARLLSNAGGNAIQGGIATAPFPLGPGPGGSGGSVIPNAQNTLELGRIRVGLSILLEGMGINLQDITAADNQALQ